MFQSKQKFGEVPKPLTYLQCLNCNTVNSRPFKDGDHIFKEVEEKCPKCGSTKMLIIGIYVREEKAKTRKPSL